MDTRRLNLKFFAAQIQIPLTNKPILNKNLVFCRNDSWVMENMDKELIAPKRVLIVGLKIPQMPQNISAQNVFLSPKVRDFRKKNSLWVSVVRDNGNKSTKYRKYNGISLRIMEYGCWIMLYIIFYARLQQKTKTNVFPYCSPCRMHKLIKSVEKKGEAFCFLKNPQNLLLKD